MEFKDFLEDYEFKAFDEQMAVEANLLTVPKFAAGAASNFVTQAGRSLGNIGAGTVRSALSAGQMGLGGLQMIGGGREPGWENVKKGWEGAEKAGAQIGRGALQGVGAVTGITPLLRGAQAANEKMLDVSGVYAPKAKNVWQDIFGMNAWGDKDKDSKTPQKTVTQKETPRRAPSANVNLASDEKSKERQELWTHLVAAYREAKSIEEKKKIQVTISKVFPEKYAEIMARKEAKKMMARGASK